MLRITLTLTLGFLLLLPASLVQAGGPWSPKEQTAFMDACVEEAAKNISPGKAKLYCSCMLETIMDKYDSPLKAEKYMGDEEMTEMAAQCLSDIESSGTGTGSNYNTSGKWPANEQEVFMESCVDEASPTVGKTKAKTYCNCMLQKIMAKYSTANDASKYMTDDEMEKMATKCIAGN